MNALKKAVSIITASVIFLLTFALPSSAAKDGFYAADAVIIVAQDANLTDNYAAERLKYYLDIITGADIPIITDAGSAEFEISVGATNRTDKDFSAYDDGSYVITSSKNTLIINGAGNKGTINGVYAFLEKVCGCRWYEAQVIVTPKNAELIIEPDIYIEYVPFFEYSETDTISSRDPEFSVANGLTGGIYKYLSPEQGGAVNYIGSASHTLVNQFCKPEDYFEEHPEYFAFYNGSRSETQLCLTNEDVKDIVTNQALALLEANHNPDAPLQILSITQADNSFYCECKNCKALDKATGSPAGTMLIFVNEIASRLKASGEYDNIAIDTFAYQYTRKAPTNVVP